jgi:hypothetical protein
MNVNRMLRLESLVMVAGVLALYVLSGGSWLLFVVLLLAPDLSMIGYAFNTRVGARAYNTAHMYLLPGIVLAFGLALSAPLAVHIGLIWLAHISIDRVLGYGLKYPTTFKDTHMQHV